MEFSPNPFFGGVSCHSLEEQNLDNEGKVDFSGNITCELGPRTGQLALDQRR
jgi:hypothetical protein